MKKASIFLWTAFSLFTLVSPGISAPAAPAPIPADLQERMNQLTYRVIILGNPNIELPRFLSYERALNRVKAILNQNNGNGAFSLNYYLLIPNGNGYNSIKCTNLETARLRASRIPGARIEGVFTISLRR